MYFDRRDNIVVGATHMETFATLKINGFLQTLSAEEEI